MTPGFWTRPWRLIHQLYQRTPRSVLAWTAALVAAVIHMMLLTTGYRLTADDVLFLYIYLHGWEDIRDWAARIAFEQGRIGQLIMSPLNIWASYMAGYYPARIAMISLYYLNFVLFAVYVSVLLRSNVKLFLFALLVAMHPLAYENMPPTSYPLQNTVPFFLLLGSRILLMRWRRSSGRARRAASLLLYVVFIFSMIITEYAFLLGTALLAAEYCVRLADNMRLGQSLKTAVMNVLRSRALWADITAVLAAFAPYALFRRLYPTLYDGNSLDAIWQVGRVAQTVAGHVLAGTIFSRLGPESLAVPWNVALVAVAVGLLTAFCLSASFQEARHIRAPWWMIGLVAGLVIYVTLPLAGAVQQQISCVEHGVCGYLDSRTSYLGVAVIVLAALAAILRKLPTVRARRLFAGAVSLVGGTISALTYTTNWLQAETMAPQAAVWERADLFACHPERLPASDERLLRLIEPQQRITIYPHIPRADYWRLYTSRGGMGWNCSTGTEREREIAYIEALGPAIVPGRPVRFSDTAGGEYLLSGWSAPEPWGVWSDGPHATLLLEPQDADPQGASLILHFNPYVGPSVRTQEVEVSVDGEIVARWALSREELTNECCRRTISLPEEAMRRSALQIGFSIANPRDPARESGSSETRRLGIGLTGMILLD